MNIRALIFDLGGVLQGLDWSPVVNSLLDLRADLDITGYREAFYHDRPANFDRYATGRMDAETFWSGVAERLNLPPDSTDRLSRSFEQVYSFLNVDLRDMLLELGGEYRLFALSNACPEIERRVAASPAYHGLFDELFFSHTIGCKKPSPEAYRHVCRRAGLAPEECVFVDNDMANIPAARAVGMHTVLYSGQEALARELEARFGIVCGGPVGAVGYTTGVFDLFHQGHLNLLRRARARCGRLVVGVTTDELCREFKGVDPVVPFEERAAVVGAVRYVDEVVAQRSMDKYEAWLEHRFDVMFASGSPTARWPEVERRFLENFADGSGPPEIVYLPYTPGVSSSLRREATGRSGKGACL